MCSPRLREVGLAPENRKCILMGSGLGRRGCSRVPGLRALAFNTSNHCLQASGEKPPGPEAEGPAPGVGQSGAAAGHQLCSLQSQRPALTTCPLSQAFTVTFPSTFSEAGPAPEHRDGRVTPHTCRHIHRMKICFQPARDPTGLGFGQVAVRTSLRGSDSPFSLLPGA